MLFVNLLHSFVGTAGWSQQGSLTAHLPPLSRQCRGTYSSAGAAVAGRGHPTFLRVLARAGGKGLALQPEAPNWQLEEGGRGVEGGPCPRGELETCRGKHFQEK